MANPTLLGGLGLTEEQRTAAGAAAHPGTQHGAAHDASQPSAARSPQAAAKRNIPRSDSATVLFSTFPKPEPEHARHTEEGAPHTSAMHVATSPARNAAPAFDAGHQPASACVPRAVKDEPTAQAANVMRGNATPGGCPAFHAHGNNIKPTHPGAMDAKPHTARAPRTQVCKTANAEPGIKTQFDASGRPCCTALEGHVGNLEHVAVHAREGKGSPEAVSGQGAVAERPVCGDAAGTAEEASCITDSAQAPIPAHVLAHVQPLLGRNCVLRVLPGGQAQLLAELAMGKQFVYFSPAEVRQMIVVESKSSEGEAV